MNKNRNEVELTIKELTQFYTNSGLSRNVRYEDLENIIELTRAKYTITIFNLKKIEPDEFSKEQLVKWLIRYDVFNPLHDREYKEHTLIKINELDIYLEFYPDDSPQVVACDKNGKYISYDMLGKMYKMTGCVQYSLRPDYEELKSKGFTLI